MKKILLPLLVLVAGAGVGGAAAYATSSVLHPAPSSAELAEEDLQFLPADKMVAPLVMPDGRLAGYVTFEVQLQVAGDQAESVTARLPLLLHAVNLRTYRTPLAAGPDGLLPDIEAVRRVVMAAATEAFGPHVVRRAAVTQAMPA